jgi:RimJ/RimL family protein N-acetyltransferase
MRENPYNQAMTFVETLAKTTADAGRELLRRAGVPQDKAGHNATGLIPICPLHPEHLTAIKKHMLSLTTHDRYLRFGYPATDEQVERYVDELKFERDDIYGIFNRNLDIVAMAHLAIIREPNRTSLAEFGVSVQSYARGRGYGGRLFERAVMHARNEKIELMYIHALSENAPMIRIAKNAGATVERDGSETEAYLRLPKRDLDSRVTELLVDQFAKANYSIKEDAKRFWSFLSDVQEIRNAVREGRHQSAE